MAFWGKKLLVANAYSDSISVIDTDINKEERRIDLGLPVRVPGEHKAAYGAGPNSIAVDEKTGKAYVALYNANAIAVVDLREHAWSPVEGMIPVGYAPASVVLDAADNVLLVANDKGIGTTVTGVGRPRQKRPRILCKLLRRGRLQYPPGPGTSASFPFRTTTTWWG